MIGHGVQHEKIVKKIYRSWRKSITKNICIVTV